MTKEMAVGIAARVWCDKEMAEFEMDSEVAYKIVDLLMPLTPMDDKTGEK